VSPPFQIHHTAQQNLEKFGKKLIGDDDVEKASQRLKRLLAEETRVSAALTLQIATGNSKEAMSRE
jgi:hypothetical protein